MSGMRVQPLDGPFGAEVDGVVMDDLDESEIRELQQAFDEYGLLVLRDAQLTYPTQQHFVEMLVREELTAPRSSSCSPRPTCPTARRAPAARAV